MFKQARTNSRRPNHAVFFTSAVLALSIGFSGCTNKATPSATGTEVQGTEVTATTKATAESTVVAEAVEGSEPATPATNPLPKPAPVTQTTFLRRDDFIVLFSALETGGMCAGPCGNVQTILYSDGVWTQGLVTDSNRTAAPATVPPPSEGRLDRALVGKIEGAIKATTAKELQALPVTQQYCPSAADGRDLAYAYYLNDVEVSVSNCTVNLGEAHPLLSLTSEALDAIRATVNP
jgi:hypothetical protein